MSNAAVGKVASAGAPFPGPGKDSADCEAFKNAVNRWCKETNERRKQLAQAKKDGTEPPAAPQRKFNDYFYEELGALDARNGTDLAARTSREVPFGVLTPGGPNISQGMDSFIADNPLTSGAATGSRLQTMHATTAATHSSTTSGVWDGARYEMNQASGGLGANRPFYPDGVRDGAPIEIKGPGDREGPDQYAKYAAASPTKPLTVIDPQNCGVDNLTKNGNCSAKVDYS